MMNAKMRARVGALNPQHAKGFTRVVADVLRSTLRIWTAQAPRAARSSLAAAAATSVKSSRVWWPFSAHSRILVAMCRLIECSSPSPGSILQARSRAISILVRVWESKRSVITLVLLGQVLGGRPRLAKDNPCMSAAFLRIPACFIASVPNVGTVIDAGRLGHDEVEGHRW